MKIELTKKQITKLFIYFLKRKRALLPFIINLALVTPAIERWPKTIKRPKRYTLTNYINFTLLCYPDGYQGDLVVNSFDWASSKEGRDYWRSISIEWREEIEEFKNHVKESYNLYANGNIIMPIDKIINDFLKSCLFNID